MREVLSVLKAADKPPHTKKAVGACKRYVIGMPYEEGGQPKVMRFGVQITDRYLLSSAAQISINSHAKPVAHASTADIFH